MCVAPTFHHYFTFPFANSTIANERKYLPTLSSHHLTYFWSHLLIRRSYTFLRYFRQLRAKPPYTFIIHTTYTFIYTFIYTLYVYVQRSSASPLGLVPFINIRITYTFYVVDVRVGPSLIYLPLIYILYMYMLNVYVPRLRFWSSATLRLAKISRGCLWAFGPWVYI